jgi:hypothetical protein
MNIKKYINLSHISKTLIILLGLLILLFQLFYNFMSYFAQNLKVTAPELFEITSKFPDLITITSPLALILTCVSTIFLVPIIEEFVFRFWQKTKIENNFKNISFISLILYFFIKITSIGINTSEQLSFQIVNIFKINDVKNENFNSLSQFIYIIIVFSIMSCVSKFFLKVKFINEILSITLSNKIFKFILIIFSIPLFALLHFQVIGFYFDFSLSRFLFYCLLAILLILIRYYFGFDKAIYYHILVNLVVVFSQIFTLNHQVLNISIYLTLVPLAFVLIFLLFSKTSYINHLIKNFKNQITN